MSNTDNLDGSAAPLLEHLKELRNRIMISIGAFVVTFIIAFLIVGHIWAFLSAPICDVLAERGQECQLQTLGPQDSFFVAMKISMWGGFVLAFPIITFQLWRFVAPGLYRNEKAAFLPFLIAWFCSLRVPTMAFTNSRSKKLRVSNPLTRSRHDLEPR